MRRVTTPSFDGFLILLLVVLFGFVACAPAHSAGIPAAANKYRSLLVRSAHAHWGLDAPIATFAAQVHQESRWMPDAVSPVGAQGMTQFMPSTSEWIAKIYPDELGDHQPLNPGWALRALVIYDRWLFARVDAVDQCNQAAKMASAYNGGIGWVGRDERLASASGADPAKWFNAVEKYTQRADWARRENRLYVRLILLRWEPLYAAAGWGPGMCEGVTL
ncbi:transglycosylase SLT domain-containing protein [Marinobacterium litorale]|uniref:transglycosylase SLT domain-containing protein n=1 Tax=Marinobacterium litorale TaxID=404770 RepID=UPI0004124252|nr:transglycosylase SLT domain-containing protein [Marinobacterium litorale]